MKCPSNEIVARRECIAVNKFYKSFDIATIFSHHVCTIVQHTIVRAIAVSYGRPNFDLSKFETLEPRSIRTFARVISSAVPRAVPKIIAIGCMVTPHTHAKYSVLRAFLCCCFFVRSQTCAQHDGEPHKGQSRKWWLKNVFSLQEVSFLGPVDDVTQEASITPKPPNFDPRNGISSIMHIYLEKLELR